MRINRSLVIRRNKQKKKRYVNPIFIFNQTHSIASVISVANFEKESSVPIFDNYCLYLDSF